MEPDGLSMAASTATSTEARAIIEQEGIILLSYQPFQAVWQGNKSNSSFNRNLRFPLPA